MKKILKKIKTLVSELNFSLGKKKIIVFKKKIYNFYLKISFFYEVCSKEIECQGAKLRIINKITTEKVFL